MARFSIGGQVVSIIGVFALDSKPLFQASICYLNHPFKLVLLDFFQDWGSREWVISFLVALVCMVAFKNFYQWSLLYPEGGDHGEYFDDQGSLLGYSQQGHGGAQLRGGRCICVAGLGQVLFHNWNVLKVTVFDVPSHWTDILGTTAIISAVIGT